MMTAELAPLAKTGGLADAVAGLADALARRAHDVRVLMPDYGRPLPRAWRIAARGRIGDVGWTELRRVGDGGAPSIYLLDAPGIDAEGAVYLTDDRDAPRFVQFTHAALAVAAEFDWKVDIVHCHDWHAGLVPALLKGPAAGTALAAAPTVLTLHNVGYQGSFPRAALAAADADLIASLAPDEASSDWLPAFLRIGVRTADAITTVSPTYAREIATTDLGMGLDGLLRARGDALTGILNGVDYSVWSSERDPYLAARFEPGDAAGKQHAKRVLCQEVGLECDAAPLFGAVTRLVEQKGMDLLAQALPELLARTPARFVLLGSGDAALEQAFDALVREHPARIAFRRGYDEPLAHRIIAGSDALLVPSRYEPCGLTQLYAMRYGTVPVVRRTGGLADTVQHFDPQTGAGTGSVFEHADVPGLVWGVTTAADWYAQPALWQRIVANAVRVDCSWDRQAEPYERLYARLLQAAQAGE